MLFSCVLCFFAVLIAAGGSTVLSCIYLGPQTPSAEFNSSVTAYCVLNHTCLLEKGYNIKSNELYWELNSQRIPQSQYAVLNETTSRVTIQPTSTATNTLTCNTDVHGQIKTTLNGMFISIGFPPEKPENLSCICYNKDKLTCTWNPGRATILQTTYTLKQSWKDEKRHNCVSDGNNTCTLYPPDFQLHIYTTFQVVAKNDLGTAESDELLLDVVDIMKPNPPDILNVVSSPPLQKALKIEWKNPLPDLYPMKYNLRFRSKDSTQWEQVPPNDIDKPRNSYALQDLQPYTKYLISVRCMQMNNKGFWSEWSREYEAITPESAPTRGPEFWRKLGDPDIDGNRLVRFMLKDLGSNANGKILGYNINISNAKGFIDSFSINGSQFNVTIPKDAVKVAVNACNSFDCSPQSLLVIPPARNRVTLPAEIDVNAFPKDGKLWVEWTKPTKVVLGYVIEWCANPDIQGCNIEWQRDPNTSKGTFLRGDIQPLVFYMIKVHPLYLDGLERPRSVGAYLQQGIPIEGPVVHSKSVEKTRAILVWEPVPLQKRNGFITNYTIKYEAKNGSLKTVTLNATQTEYAMTSLSGNTVYSVGVTANTEKGGMEGRFTFSTNRFDTGEVEAIVVSSCIGFLLLVLIGGILLCNKRDLIKKHIWPNVPDPSKSNIAQWSPQTPTRHEPKSHPFQDGSFTDVSVVEITADEKTSYSKADVKSVDVIKKNTSEGLSSGIGGSSCLSSPQLSISDADEVESGQNTSSTVQYSSVIISGYRGQQPIATALPTFSRSESTQPLLESEERPDEQQVLEIPNQYFKQNCTAQDSTGRLPASQQENLSSHIQSPHLAANGQEINFNTGQNVSSEGHPAPSEVDITESTETNSYLPQTVRRGGYIPQ